MQKSHSYLTSGLINFRSMVNSSKNSQNADILHTLNDEGSDKNHYVRT